MREEAKRRKERSPKGKRRGEITQQRPRKSGWCEVRVVGAAGGTAGLPSVRYDRPSNRSVYGTISDSPTAGTRKVDAELGG